MGVYIIGGRNNTTAQVTSEGMLETLCTNFDVTQHVNFVHEESFTLQDTLTPSPSADFLYIKNLDNKPLAIVDSELWCDAAETIDVYRNPTGTPTGGTTITPANCNFGSNLKANGTFYRGTDVGGLSSGELRNRIRLQSGVPRRYNFTNWTLLPKNATIKFYVHEGNSELDIWLQFFYVKEGLI